MTISRLLTDTGQEVLASTVFRDNRHQLSKVIASTLYPAPDTIVSLYTESNRWGHCSVGSANDQVVHMVIDYVAFPCDDDVSKQFAMIRLVLVEGS